MFVLNFRYNFSGLVNNIDFLADVQIFPTLYATDYPLMHHPNMVGQAFLGLACLLIINPIIFREIEAGHFEQDRKWINHIFIECLVNIFLYLQANLKNIANNAFEFCVTDKLYICHIQPLPVYF